MVFQDGAILGQLSGMVLDSELLAHFALTRPATIGVSMREIWLAKSPQGGGVNRFRRGDVAIK
ncbi:MAG: hypothetical protein GX422_13695 [Deltaproteobacteria bacterium]|nr:hypothetical protein [Deltaproteobacteria bacterium]